MQRSSAALACLVVFGYLPAVQCRYVFLSRALGPRVDGPSFYAYATFSDNGQPGNASSLSTVAGMIIPFWSEDESLIARQSFPLEQVDLGDGKAELKGPISASSAPFALALSFTYGVEAGANGTSLVKYSSHAGDATSYRGWLQVALYGETDFELLLQPYAAGSGTEACDSSVSSSGRDAGASPISACIKAVVQFQGQPIGGTIEFWNGEGAALGTATASSGTGAVSAKLPLSADGRVFAAVRYLEQAPGQYKGHRYDIVDHRATAFATVPSATSMTGVASRLTQMRRKEQPPIQARVSPHLNEEAEQVDVGSFLQTGTDNLKLDL